jgi:hypothetical protein
VRYELGFDIPEDVILPSHSHENLKSYTAIYVVLKEIRPAGMPGIHLPEAELLIPSQKSMYKTHDRTTGLKTEYKQT